MVNELNFPNALTAAFKAARAFLGLRQSIESSFVDVVHLIGQWEEVLSSDIARV
jgi:hypothetical protein